MNVLVINCGSSSLKYQLINSESEEVLAKGLCERIGMEGSCLNHTPKGGDKVVIKNDMPSHTTAIQMVIDALTDAGHGVVKSLEEIDAVGHRIVHGGEKFAKSVIITEEVMKAIEECNDLAPLHNPANLIGINACKEIMPNVPMVAVFDTAFHQTMPAESYLYGLPYDYYKNYKIRRYGFHGTSHDFVSARAAEILGKKREDLNIIVCHLGNGASISAVKNGKCIDTSMGFTPLDGLIMGTRCGSIDPAIVEFIANKENKTVSEVNTILNKESGVYGLSNKISSDFRDLSKAMDEGNELAKITLETYAQRIAKFIGAYVAELGKVDIIAFTAGIGENDSRVRAMVGKYFEFLNTAIDDKKNDVHGEEAVISRDGDPVTVMVVPTNEELAICRQTVELV